MLDTADKCATVCHGMSKSLLLIVSTEIMKIKIFYLENTVAERFKRDWDIGVMQRGKCTLGLHEV